MKKKKLKNHGKTINQTRDVQLRSKFWGKKCEIWGGESFQLAFDLTETRMHVFYLYRTVQGVTV